MGHYALTAVKGLHSHYYIMSPCSQGWRISSRRANNNCWGDVCEAQTWRRHWTEIAHGLRAPPEAKGWQIQGCLYFIALQGCSPRASIYREGPGVCLNPNPTLSNSRVTHRAAEPLHFPTGTVFLPQSQQVHKLITAVLSLEIPCYWGFATSRL